MFIYAPRGPGAKNLWLLDKVYILPVFIRCCQLTNLPTKVNLAPRCILSMVLQLRSVLALIFTLKRFLQKKVFQQFEIMTVNRLFFRVCFYVKACKAGRGVSKQVLVYRYDCSLSWQKRR